MFRFDPMGEAEAVPKKRTLLKRRERLLQHALPPAVNKRSIVVFVHEALRGTADVENDRAARHRA